MLHKIFAHISPESPQSGSRSRAFTALLLTLAVLAGLSFSGVANAKTKANPATVTGLSHLGSLHVKNQRNFSPRKPLASAPKAKQMGIHPNASGISAQFSDFSYYPSFNSTGFTAPFGVAVDSSNNIYVADEGTNTVYLETQKAGGGYTQSVVATGFSFVYGINVDINKNVYVDDYGTGVLYIEKPNGDGTYTQGVVDATLGEPLANVPDYYGDVYVADGTVGVIEEYNNGDGTYTAYAIDSGDFVSPNAIALDSYGNLYVGDYIYTAGSPYSILYSLTSYGYGGHDFSAPNFISDNLYGVSGVGVTVDGTLIVSDTGLGVVPSVLYSFIPTAQGNYNQFFLSDNVYEALGVAIDSLGNIYTSDIAGGEFLEISDNFGAVQVGMANGTNNYVTANFFLSGTGTVGSLVVQTEGSSGIAFTDSGLGNCAGAVVPTVTYCSAVIQFAPTTPGIITGNVTLFDNVTPTPNYIIFSQSFSGTAIAPRASFLPGTWSYIYDGNNSGMTPAKNFAKNRTKMHEKIPQQAKTAFKGMQIGGSSTYPGDQPDGIVVDPSGNYFVADPDFCVIYASFDAGQTWTTLPNASGEVCPSGGLAVDGNGNVFYTAWTTGPAEILVDAKFGDPTVLGSAAYGNPYTVVGNTNTGSAALYYANNLTVDAYDNVYFTGSDDSNNDAYAFTIPASGYFYGSDPLAVSRLPGTFYFLSGIAADNVGNIFVSDYYGGQVVEYTANSNGTYGQYPIARGLDTPSALDLTADGNLYIVDSGDDTGISALYLAVSNGLCCSTSYGYNLTPYVLSSYYLNGNSYFWNFTTDQNDNFYLTDDGYWSGEITQIDVNDPPSIGFDTTNIGAVSADSPEVVFLISSGNDTLVLPVPSSGFNPSISPSFLLNSSYYTYFPGGQVPAFDCSLVSSGGTPYDVNADSACALPISFVPLVAGTINGTLVVTDNSLYGSLAVPMAKGAMRAVKGHANLALTKGGKLAKNAHPMASGSTAQTINLTGIGVDFFAVDFTVTGGGVPPVVKAGGSLDLSFTVAPTGENSTIPLAVVMSAGGGPQGTSYTFSPAVIPAGSGSTTVVLTINIPIDYVAKNDAPAAPGQQNGTKLPVAPLALALLLLPMAGKLRKAGKRMSRMVAMMLLAIAGITATATLIGCGANKAAVYEITVTGTSGILSHSTSFDITVQGR